MHDNEILPSTHRPPRRMTPIKPDPQNLHPVILTAVAALLGPPPFPFRPKTRLGAYRVWDTSGEAEIGASRVWRRRRPGRG